MENTLRTIHEETYKLSPQTAYFSPGVLNLLGTHTEEEGGKVLSLTHTIGLNALVTPRIDRTIQIRMADARDTEPQSLNLETLEYDTTKHHGALLSGLLKKLVHEGYDVSKGMDITIGGPLKKESGLGFDSSLLMLLMTLVLDQNAIDLKKEKRLRYARHVLSDLKPPMTTPTDPLTLLFSKKGHLLYCCSKTFECETVPFDFEGHALILFNTNRNPEHSLNSVMKRKKEVTEAFQTIHRKRVVDSLCDLDIREFNVLKELITKPTAKKRVEHVVFESDRASQAKDAIARGDYILLSGLIEQSHTSLRELYEVSGEELNFLATEADKHGALASKLTGVGFGGALVALYEREDLPEDFSDLKHRYQKRFHKTLDVMELTSDGSVRKTKA